MFVRDKEKIQEALVDAEKKFCLDFKAKKVKNAVIFKFSGETHVGAGISNQNGALLH